MVKTCIKCETNQPIENFPKMGNICKSCVKIYQQEYRKNNKEKLSENKKVYHQENKNKINEYSRGYRKENKDSLKAQRKNYVSENRENIKEYNSKYREENLEDLKIYQQVYRRENKEKVNALNRDFHNRNKNNPAYKFRKNISRMINFLLKQNNSSKAGESCLQYLPFTLEELEAHIENHFEPWMTWENHGKYILKTWNDNDQTTWTWQLDHIIPQSKLPYSSMEEENFQKCWALENLRPYSAKRNIIDNCHRK